MKKHLLLIPVLSLLLVGCAKAPESIKIVAPATTIEVDDTVQLSIEATPEGTSTDVVYTTSQTDIVEVSAKGLVLGLSIGKARIRAESKADKSVFAQITINVVAKGEGPGDGGDGGETGVEKKITLNFVSPSIFSEGTNATGWFDESKTIDGIAYSIAQGRNQKPWEEKSYLILCKDTGIFYNTTKIGSNIKKIELTYPSNTMGAATTVDVAFGNASKPAASGSPVAVTSGGNGSFTNSGSGNGYFAMYALGGNVQIETCVITYIS